MNQINTLTRSPFILCRIGVGSRRRSGKQTIQYAVFSMNPMSLSWTYAKEEATIFNKNEKCFLATAFSEYYLAGKQRKIIQEFV